MDDQQRICNILLQEMIEYRDLTHDQRDELVRFIRDNGSNCHDFMRFLIGARTNNPFESFNGVSVPQLFESYKQCAQLVLDVGELSIRVRTKLADLGSKCKSRGGEEYEYYSYLMGAIDQQLITVQSVLFHESRLNIDQLSELMTALKVILTLSELNETHAFSCLYLLNHTGFDEYVQISNNNILEDILRDAGQKIEQVVPDPAIITDLNDENDERRMEELGRIFRLLNDLNSEGVGLNIVDTRIPVIHPNVARKCLEGDEEECAISMDKLKSLPLPQKVMLTCGHPFKKDEITRWLKHHGGRCPICRAPAQINPAYKGSTYRPTHVPPGKIAKELVARKPELVDPVVLHCGHVVEKSVMDSRFERNIKTCPKCGVSATEYIIPSGGSRKHKRNGRGKSKKLIKRKKTIKRRKNNTSR